jgi:CelD/BcsL family acetyltransferase involved in cellulose biosynthesis
MATLANPANKPENLPRPTASSCVTGPGDRGSAEVSIALTHSAQNISDSPGAAHALECHIASSFDEVAEHRDEWDALTKSVDADIYMTFDWCRVWWEYYGEGRKLLLFLFRSRGTLVGIVPVFTERVRLGPVSLRLAKLVGSDHAMTMCDPPVTLDAATSAFAMVIERMMKSEGVDAVVIGPLSGTKWNGFRWEQIAQGSAFAMRTDRRHVCHTVFHLLPTMAEYWESLAAGDARKLRRRIRLLEEKGTLNTRSVTEPDDCVEMFEKFRQMHERQWQSEGKLGHFGDWPKGLEFNRALVKSLGELGRVLMTEVRVGDEPVAYHYCFRFGTREFWRLPARLVGKDWDRIGLGNVALLKKIEIAIGNGTSYAEDGFGHYDYKLAVGGKEYPTRSILFFVNKPGTRCRVRVFSNLSRVLHFVYYRVWFLKVAPNMPFRRGPLAKIWIRSRL